MTKNFEEELKQVIQYLKNDFNWKDNYINFAHQPLIKKDLETMTPRKAAEAHYLRCFKSEIQEKKSDHSDFSKKSSVDRYTLFNLSKFI